ncbi:histidine--tRNA ligase [Rikenella microfusus]|uniref:Histidine--tRNA ligase n=1 Tax=Rikenella microfusus TaxID=28139 RepID=A0A379MT42_9BACT|nr:histidine--tRNA ligase [Rikenella microfusus]SUE34705.1 Histidine--tRNA ligase [Rikenella microfusus]
MAVQKPSIPKGTRDFSPVEMARRNYLFDTIKSVFRRYGFQPLETPSMENLSTLLGKYGEEGDKLLFKVLNSGNFLKGIDAEEVQAAAESDNPVVLGNRICEKGLRYDLTVPFARYVVQHQNELVFPFKRYQIQPVWRADRPQKGRYREFYQCDVDVVGSKSLLNEVELIQIVQEVFAALKIRVTLKINNRKILYGISETIGHADKMMDITVAIDKLDKIGLDAVNEELAGRGLSPEAVAALRPILELSGSNREKLAAITAIIGEKSATGLKGIQEVTTILDYAEALGVVLPVELDLSLARGLNYYTGAIFEVKAMDFPMGSICGGGRYDDLTGIFGLPDTSGVGISFGADRIYDVLLGLDLFPAETAQSVRALFVNFGGAEELGALRLLSEVRRAGIAAEIYPEAAKMKKQFDYAQKRDILYMVFVGENELAARTATVKNIVTGEQRSIPFEAVADSLR